MSSLHLDWPSQRFPKTESIWPAATRYIFATASQTDHVGLTFRQSYCVWDRCNYAWCMPINCHSSLARMDPGASLSQVLSHARARLRPLILSALSVHSFDRWPFRFNPFRFNPILSFARWPLPKTDLSPAFVRYYISPRFNVKIRRIFTNDVPSLHHLKI